MSVRARACSSRLAFVFFARSRSVLSSSSPLFVCVFTFCFLVVFVLFLLSSLPVCVLIRTRLVSLLSCRELQICEGPVDGMRPEEQHALADVDAEEGRSVHLRVDQDHSEEMQKR